MSFNVGSSFNSLFLSNRHAHPFTFDDLAFDMNLNSIISVVELIIS